VGQWGAKGTQSEPKGDPKGAKRGHRGAKGGQKKAKISQKEAFGGPGPAWAAKKLKSTNASTYFDRLGLHFGSFSGVLWCVVSRCVGVCCEKANIAETIASEA